MDVSLVPFQHQTADGTVALREACWKDGKPYFTRQAIGEWLGYKDDPAEAVRQIVGRCPHILPFEGWVRLTLPQGGTQEVRVYDPIGLQLIVFESRQPKAIQFKVMVAHLVHAFMRGELRPAICRPAGSVQMDAALCEILSLPHGSKTKAMEALGATMGLSRSALYNRRKQDPSVVARPKGKWAKPRGTAPDVAERHARIADALEAGTPPKQVASDMGVSKAQVRRVIRRKARAPHKG